MQIEESTARWIELLAGLRDEHLARLHAFGRQFALGALVLTAVVLLGVVIGLDPLWDLSFQDSDLATSLALDAGALFAAAGVLVALALYQQRRDRTGAIALLDRAIAELLAGVDPHVVLGGLSERMRRLAPPRHETGGAPYLPSVLDGRWLGTRLHTKVFLGCALLLLSALLFAGALVLAAPVDYGDEDGGTPTACAAPAPTGA